MPARHTGSRSATEGAAEQSPTGEPAGTRAPRHAETRQAAAKKSAAKRSAAKSSPAKKSAAKKTAAKKTGAKKSVAKKSAAKKTAAKKSSAKKSVAKKSAAKKTAARKSSAKKSSAKKSSANKSAAKKSAPAKSAVGSAAAQPAASSAHARRGAATGRVQRAKQQAQERRRAARERKESDGDEGASQLGQRGYPENPLPKQHLRKPGLESDLDPRPQYEAPGYRGSGKLHGRVALITGGDSGIGRAVAVLFAREGADIAIGYLDEHSDAGETQRAVEAEGRTAILIPGDVADSTYAEHAVQRTVDELGGLDILVNNAAYQQHQKALEDITDEQLERTFRTNIFGYFYMARAALRHLEEGGVILNSGSVTGIDGSAELLDYAATKGAIHAFTKSLAQNVLSRGIRVNGVAPGPVWTPLNPADIDADDVAEFGASVPMKRPAQPEELAPAYVFLAAASDSSYITGEVLNVFGGKPTP
jgi:NAD(P)-dependent dehydrogenase (short-subunit alcohol dehydrogenase family)